MGKRNGICSEDSGVERKRGAHIRLGVRVDREGWTIAFVRFLKVRKTLTKRQRKCVF